MQQENEPLWLSHDLFKASNQSALFHKRIVFVICNLFVTSTPAEQSCIFCFEEKNFVDRQCKEQPDTADREYSLHL